MNLRVWCLAILACCSVIGVRGSQTCNKAVDVLILVEDSDQLPIDNEATVKSFLISIVNHFVLGKTNVQVGLQLYDDSKSTVAFDLHTYTKISDMVEAIQELKFQRPDTVPNINKALQNTYSNMLTVASGERSCSPLVVILISFSGPTGPNGMPNVEQVDVTYARQIQNAGGLILALGVGPHRDTQALSQYAQGVNNYYDFVDFSPSSLTDNAATIIANRTCDWSPPSPNYYYPCVMDYVQADVVFVVDISKNMNSDIIKAINSFVASSLQPFPYNNLQGVQAALITFSRVSDVAVPLSKSKSYSDFVSRAQQALTDSPCSDDERNIADALENVYNHVFTDSAGYRQDAAHTVVVITSDCLTGSDAVDIANKLRTDKNADVHVITLGRNRGFWKEALEVAGDFDHLYDLDTNPEVLLPNVLVGEAWKFLCKAGSYLPTTPSPPPPRTTLAPGQIDACADIVFILDESEVLLPAGSPLNEWETAWSEVKSFITSMSSQYVIGQDHTRFAVIGFGTKGQVQVPLTASTDLNALSSAINGMDLIAKDPLSAARSTADGLSVAYDHITQNQRVKKAPVYAIFIAVYVDDVNGDMQVSAAAQKLQTAGVSMYLVPMEDYSWDQTFKNEIQIMTSQTTKLYEMGNYGDLATSALARDLQSRLKNEAICGRRSRRAAVFQEVDTIDTMIKQQQKRAAKTSLKAATPWPCPGFSADIAVLIDQSTSISTDAYLNQIVPFVKQIAQDFDISASNTHMSMVRYSNPKDTEMTFNFAFGVDPTQITKVVDQMKFGAGSTYLETALNLTYSTVFTPAQGMRASNPKITRVAVLITDGLASDASNPSNIPAASMLANDKQVQIFAIGAGPLKSTGNLQMLTARSDPHNVFMVGDYQSFYTAATNAICRKG